MQQYTNRFQYAIDANKTEFCLNFLQEYPEISLDDSNTVNGATESIVKLVMSYSSALELLKMLENALKEG
ncbi:hypothetical protein [Anaerotignum faecicola]